MDCCERRPQVVTNLRLAGQYDERLLGSLAAARGAAQTESSLGGPDREFPRIGAA